MGKESAQRIVYSVIDLLQKRVKSGIPREDYPEVSINPDANNPRYYMNTNVIELSSEDDLKNLSYIAEEAAHFVRAKTKPQGVPREHLTDEFFGFLGRRMIYDSLGTKDKFKSYFPKGEPRVETEVGSKKAALARVRELRDYKGDFSESEDVILDDPEKAVKLLKRGLGKQKARRDILTHYRGYEFASNVDLNKLDYTEVFSLDDKTVRKRFFRPNPIYEESGDLEHRVAAGFLIGFGVFLLLTHVNITGNMIANSKAVFGWGALAFLGLLTALYIKLRMN